MTQLNFGRDVQGFNAYAPMPADLKYNATLTDGAETHITLPSAFPRYIVAFSYQPGTDIWVDFSGATAAIPAGATLAPTTSELNPATRLLPAGAEISMITDNTTADVGVMVYVGP